MPWGAILGGLASGAAGALLGGGGGGSSGTQTVQTNPDPWSGAQPGLLDLYGGGRQAYQTPQPFYPMQTFADLTQSQLGGMYGGLGYMQDTFAPRAEGYVGDLQSMINSPAGIATNPAVLGMMGANESAVTDTLQRQWLPGIQQGAVASGNTGSTKRHQADALAIGEAAKQLANANAQTQFNAYQTAVGQATNAAQMMPGALGLGMMPYGEQERIGGIAQLQNQRAIDEAMQRWYYPRDEESLRLQQLNSIMAGIPMGNTQTTSGTMPGSNRMADALGMGLAGARLFGNLGSSGSTASSGTPWFSPSSSGGLFGNSGTNYFGGASSPSYLGYNGGGSSSLSGGGLFGDLGFSGL